MYINHCNKKKKTYIMIYTYKNEVNSINNFKSYDDYFKYNSYSFNDFLKDIHNLFISKFYKYKIGAKSSPDSIEQKIIYFNPINGNDKYTLSIKSLNHIKVEVPLKNSNYYYTTIHNNIINAYYYLNLHLQK